MSKMRALSRLALGTLPALAGALLIASVAAAVDAPKTISSEMCNYASNKPALLQTQINALLTTLAFTGLPADECDEFTKRMVKSCLQLVKATTRCSLDINATAGLDAGKMSEFGCEAEPDKDDQKTCKSTVKSNTKSNLATAGQPVQLLDENTCNGSFALNMSNRCIAGTPAP